MQEDFQTPDISRQRIPQEESDKLWKTVHRRLDLSDESTQKRVDDLSTKLDEIQTETRTKLDEIQKELHDFILDFKQVC